MGDVPPRPHIGGAHLEAWLAEPGRSSLPSRTLRNYRDGILAAIRLRLSNGGMEDLNNKVSVLKHRAYGFHSFVVLAGILNGILGSPHPCALGGSISESIRRPDVPSELSEAGKEACSRVRCPAWRKTCEGVEKLDRAEARPWVTKLPRDRFHLAHAFAQAAQLERQVSGPGQSL